MKPDKQWTPLICSCCGTEFYVPVSSQRQHNNNNFVNDYHRKRYFANFKKHKPLTMRDKQRENIYWVKDGYVLEEEITNNGGKYGKF
jgi:hypothetical protein